MNSAVTIESIKPAFAIPGGEIVINCEGFAVNGAADFRVYFDGRPGRVVGASAERVIATVPDGLDGTDVAVQLAIGDERSAPRRLVVGKKIAENMHIVSNPAIDPKDDSLILTRSGSRGQVLPATLYRLHTNGRLLELSTDVLNPTGLAFGDGGEFFVTNRSDGVLCRIDDDEVVVTLVKGLGVATGIAINSEGETFVGDRSGSIYRINEFDEPELFTTIEPSVSAYHMAFGPDGRLFLTAPGLASFDAVYAIDRNGTEARFFRGLGRPQGIAFDISGNLYVAACYRGQRGIVRINPDGDRAELYVAGGNVIGLCFTRRGEMVVATSEAAFSLPVNLYGTLLK